MENIKNDLVKYHIHDKGPEHDVEMLKRLKGFDITDDRFVRHILTKIAPKDTDRAVNMILNWVNGKVGSAILEYDQKYVE